MLRAAAAELGVALEGEAESLRCLLVYELERVPEVSSVRVNAVGEHAGNGAGGGQYVLPRDFDCPVREVPLDVVAPLP